MKKFDIIIVMIIVVLTAVFGIYKFSVDTASASSDLVANVYVDGKFFKSIALAREEKTVELNTDYGKNILKVYSDGVEINSADCPDQLCKGFGFKDKPGDQIVCLPHHLYLEVR